MTETQVQPDDRVEAPPSKDPAVRRFIIAAMSLGYGLYTVYDHYILGNYRYEDDAFKYLFNHYMPFILVPVGLVFLVWALLFLGRRLVADPDGIRLAGKPTIAWSDIRQVDATKLASKGLLELHYGQGSVLKLDKYDFQDAPFRSVVALLEKHVPADKVTR